MPRRSPSQVTPDLDEADNIRTKAPNGPQRLHEHPSTAPSSPRPPSRPTQPSKAPKTASGSTGFEPSPLTDTTAAAPLSADMQKHSLSEQLDQVLPPVQVENSLPRSSTDFSLPSDIAAVANEVHAQDQKSTQQGISGWLSKLSLGHYAAGLLELGVKHPSDIELLTEQELASMGMRPVEKRKMRKAAAAVEDL